jgi:tRNA threonylcarbamoyladenosine biosynthesis protein TsaE
METTHLTVTTSSPGQTLALGRRLAALLEPGDVICLFGQLGAGKTCLVQGICLGLGAEEGAVSPSFTLVNEYLGRLPVFHFDCYRLDGPRDLDQIGYDDYLGRDGVVLIEWAERIGSRLPDERLDVRMERVSDDVRRITLEPRGPRWQGSGIEKMQA